MSCWDVKPINRQPTTTSLSREARSEPGVMWSGVVWCGVQVKHGEPCLSVTSNLQNLNGVVWCVVCGVVCGVVWCGVVVK